MRGRNPKINLVTAFKSGFLLLAVFISALLVSGKAQFADAAITQLPFAAQLTTTAGINVPDGTYSITFRLYTQASGGVAIWSETQSTAVTKGEFQVYLGSVSPLTGVNFNQSPLYLGFQVGTDPEMTPRYELGSVPSALNSSALNGLSSTAFTQNSQNNTLTGNNTFTGTTEIQPAALSGTALDVNTSTGFAGNLINLAVNGGSKFSVDQLGNTSLQGSLTVATGETVTSGGISVTGNSIITGNLQVTGALSFGSINGTTQYTNTFTPVSASAGWAVAAQGQPLNTPNSSLLAIGEAPFDGSSSGTFNGVSAGTYLGINAGSGFGGNLVDYQVAGVSKFSATATGAVTEAGKLTVTSGGLTVSAGGFTVTGNSSITGTLGGLTGLTVVSGGATITGNSTINGTLGGLTGLTVVSGGASVTGGLSNNAGGITGTGAITGATSINASGTITGGTLTDGTLSVNSGAVTGGTTAVFGTSETTPVLYGAAASGANLTLQSTSNLTKGNVYFNGTTAYVDASSNLFGASLNVGAGSVTSGLVNGQTISSSANFTGTVTSADALTVTSGGLTVSAGGATITGNETLTGNLLVSGSHDVGSSGTPFTNGYFTNLVAGNISTSTTSAFGAPVTITSATNPQLTVKYDNSNYYTTAVASNGAVTFDATGAGAAFNFADGLTANVFNSSGVTITGGTIDGTAVGATTRSTGAFTTLAANSGLTVSSGGAAITGNSSVTGTLQVSSTLTASNGFTLSAGTLSLPNNSVTNSFLANSSLTVTAGTNLSGGGSVALGSSVTVNVVNNPTFSGLITGQSGLTISAGGANISGGITNNAGGITNTGAISGVTGYAQSSGDFAQSGTGTFGTGTGNVSLNGSTTVASGNNLTVTAGTFIQGYSGTTGSASTLTVTDSSASGATTLNGSSIALVGTATSGTNGITGLSLANVTPAANNTFTGINVGTGFNSILAYNGTSILNGTGILQSGSVSGSYTGITGVGTIAAGTWQGTTIAVNYGGTGISSYTSGDLLYATAPTTLSKLSIAGTNGLCLVSNGANPAWGSCAGTGSGVNLQAAYSNGNTISTTSGNDLAITLNANSNATFNIATGNTGEFAVQNSGVDILSVNTTTTTIASGGIAITGNSSINGTLTGLTGLTVASGGANITGGINNHAGGVTNAGAISGATSVNASGTITGGTLTDGTLSVNSGAVTGGTTAVFGTSETTPILYGGAASGANLTLQSTSNITKGNVYFNGTTAYVDASSNLFGASLNVGAGTVTSGLVNGQTISSSANFTGTVTSASTLTITSGGLTVSGGGAAITGNTTLTGNLLASGSRDVGSSGTPFANGYFTNVVAGNISTSTASAFGAPVTITSATSPQFTVKYDGSNYYTTAVASNGAVTFDATGAGAAFNFADGVTANVFASSGVTITGGTIDGTSVGATTRSTGAFTTLAANSGLTVSSGGAAITGNSSVTGTLQVSSTLTASNGFTLSAGTLSLPASSVTNTFLANSSLTVTAGTNLSGGGLVALGSSTTIDVINNPTFSGLITGQAGLTISAGGASISGGINNHAGGITNTGSIAGATSINASGAIQGGTLTDGTASLASGSLSGITGYAQASGNFAQSGTGTFGTGTGNVSLNGSTTVASGSNLTVTAGTYIQGYSATTGSAQTLTVTNSGSSGANTLTGTTIAIVGTNNGTGTNVTNGLAFSNVTAATNNTYNGISFGTGLTSLLTYNGTPLINGSGVAQSALISGAYSNITGVGTIATGTWQGSTIGVQWGGTGDITLASNGVLYGNGTGAIGVTAAGTTGQCLVATTSSAPTWSSCAGSGSGATLQAAYTNGNTVSTTNGSDLAVTLNSTSNATFNIATGNTGKFAVQNNGTDLLRITIAGGTVVNSGNFAVTSGTTTLGGALSVTSGGLNLNATGITNAGAITGATSINASGTITGGTLTDGTASINAGAISGATTIAANGKETLSGTGATELAVTGAPAASGTSSLIQAGTAIAQGSANGNYLGVNTGSNFTGNLLELENNSNLVLAVGSATSDVTLSKLAPTSSTNTWTQANTNGYGNANVLYTFSQTTFNGAMYAGTYNGTNGAQIYKSTDGANWNLTNVSGFGTTNNQGVYSLIVFNGFIYAGTQNNNGTQIWKSADGTTWTQSNISGFGSSSNNYVYGMGVFNGALYAGTHNSSTGTQVWKTTDGANWTQVNVSGFGSANNTYTYAFTVFDGALYAGTQNTSVGTQVWKTTDGANWTQANANGFGSSSTISTNSLTVFNGQLYAGTQNSSTGTQIWRSPDGANWTQINTSGFGSSLTTTTYALAPFNGSLYAGTFNTTTGTQIWSAPDGATWSQVNTSGFGGSTKQGTYSMTTFNGGLYAGTNNTSGGSQLWALTTGRFLSSTGSIDVQGGKIGTVQIESGTITGVADISVASLSAASAGIGTLSISSVPTPSATGVALSIGNNTIASGSSNGTFIGLNTQAAFTGDLANLQVNGTTEFKVTGAGAVTTNGALTINSGGETITAGGINLNATGITNAGAITGATSINASGTITGGTLTDGTLSVNSGAVTGGTTAVFSTSETTPTLYGGVSSGGNLTLQSTSNASKGNVYFNGVTAYVDSASNLFGAGLNVGAGTITSGLINGQTISSSANFTGTVTSANTLTVTSGGLTVSAGGAAITGNETLTGNLLASGSRDVGSSGTPFNNGYFTNLVAGNITTTTSSSFNAPVTITSATSPQFTVKYDGSNYYTTAVASNGAVTFDATGAGAAFTFADGVTANNFTSSGVTITGGTINSTSIGATTRSTGAFTTLAANSGLTVSSGGAAITGGINNNAGGITNAGAISGATSINASGTITGGTLTDGTASINGGAISGVTTIAANNTETLSGTGANELAVTGAPAANGTSSLVQLGTAITGGNTSGTYFGINAGSGYTGNLVDLQVNNTSEFKVDASGNVTANGLTAGSLTIDNQPLTVLNTAATTTGTEGSLYFGRNQVTSDVFDETQSNFAQLWVNKGSSLGWFGIAMSANGSRQTAVVSGGNIYISSDYGNTWASVASSTTWKDIAMSSDGKYQTAVDGGPGFIWISSDYGNTWTQEATSQAWKSVAMSANGQYQTAVIKNGTIYVSTNYGVTWTTEATTQYWSSVAMSANGQYQTAVVGVPSTQSGNIWISSNYGVTWTSEASSSIWESVAMSSDGSRQAATLYNGNIYLSTNYGVTWTSAGLTSQTYQGIAMSSDGARMIADYSFNNLIYSTNYGATWTAVSSLPPGATSVQETHMLAMDSDGSRLAYAANTGGTHSISESVTDHTSQVGSLALTGTGANEFSVTGAPASSATSSLAQIGAAISGGSTSGTYLGLNAANSFAGNLADLQTNNASEFKVSATGAVTEAAGLTISSGGLTVTGNSTIAGTLGGLTGLTVASGGASISGGLNNNAGGITAAGAIAGATSINASGAITGGTLTDGTLSVNSGAITGGTTAVFSTSETTPTLYGGASSGGNLTLQSTSNASKGNVYFNGVTAYVDSASNLFGAGLNVGAGTITSGAINGQTISSSANFTGTVTSANTLTITTGGLTVSAGGAAITGNETLTGNLLASGSRDVGSSGTPFNNGYFTNVVAGNISTSTSSAFGAPVTITSATSPQFTVKYDGSNYYTTAVASNGAVTFDATGAGAAFTFADGVTANNFTSSGVTITGGTIDGTAVGATTRSTGAFTTLAANSGLTVSSGGITVTGNSTITGTLGGLTGLTVVSGGANITGNSTITGTLGNLTGLSLASGNFSQTGTGTFATGTGTVSLNGATTVATGNNFAITNGTYIQGYSATSGTASTLTVTDSSASGVTTLTGSSIAMVGTVTSGSNAITGLSFANVTGAVGDTFTGINFGTGLNTLMAYNGSAIFNGTGILQTGSVSGSYTGITGVGTITAGTWQGTAVAVNYGGTGTNTLATNGVLFGNGTSAVGVTAAGTTGQCLIATTSSAPTWGSCAGSGSGVTLQTAYNGGNTITTTSGNDLAVTLASNSNATFNLATGNTGKFAVQNNGTDLLKVTIAGGTVVNSGNFAVTSGTTTLGGALSVTSGGINVNATGITNAGAISGATSINASGTIQGGTLTDGTLSSTAGVVTGAVTLAVAPATATGIVVTVTGQVASLPTGYYGLQNNGTATASGSHGSTAGGIQNTLTATGNSFPSTATVYGVNNVLSINDAGVGYGSYTKLTTNNSGGDGSTGYGNYVTNTGAQTGTQYAYYANLGATGLTNDYGLYIQGGSGNYIQAKTAIGSSSNTNDQLSVTSTGSQARFYYDSTDYSDISTASNGLTTINAAGSAPGINLAIGGTTIDQITSTGTTSAYNLALSGTGANELAVSGAPLTTSGGSSSLVQIGTAISGGSGSGTYLGLNAAAAFAGNLADLQTNGTSEFKVTAAGAVTTNGALTVASGGETITAGGLNLNNTGITNAGSIAGISSISSSGTIASTAANTAFTANSATYAAFQATGTPSSSGVQSLLQLGSAIVNGSSSGNFIGVNSGSGFGGNLVELEKNGTTEFAVTAGGAVTENGGLTINTGGLTVTAGGINVNSTGITNAGAISGATTIAANGKETLSGTGGTELAVSGAPAANGTSSLAQFGTAVAQGSANGNYLGVNTASNFTGNLLELENNSNQVLAVGASTSDVALSKLAPTSSTNTWAQANSNGFANTNNRSTPASAVFNGALYMGTFNFSDGAEIYRSFDGSTWTQANLSGFGDTNNDMISSLVVFKDALYAATDNANGTEVWRTTNGFTWLQVNANGFNDANNDGTTQLSIFNGALYAGTYNNTEGTQVWRATDGTNWSQVNTSGFGSTSNAETDALTVFNGVLYDSTFNSSTGAQIWRSTDGANWNSANTPGFGDTANDAILSASVFNGVLYVGVGDGTGGGQIYRSFNGTAWSLANTPGFGDANNDRVVSLGVFNNMLYAGTENSTSGAEIYAAPDGLSWNQVNTSGFGNAGTSFEVTSFSSFKGTLYAGVHNNSAGIGLYSLTTGRFLSSTGSIDVQGGQIGNVQIENGSITGVGDLSVTSLSAVSAGVGTLEISSVPTASATSVALGLGDKTIASGSSNGTFIGLNTQAAFTGNLADLQVNGTSEFKVTGGGAVTTNGALTINSGGETITAGGINLNGTGITNAGAIAGATSVNASGTITGGTLTDGTLSIHSGAVTGGTTAVFSTSETTPTLYGGVSSGGNLTLQSTSNASKGTVYFNGTTAYVDSASNLFGAGLNVGAGTITSGLVNGQTISSSANFTGTVTTANTLTVTSGGLTVSSGGAAITGNETLTGNLLASGSRDVGSSGTPFNNGYFTNLVAGNISTTTSSAFGAPVTITSATSPQFTVKYDGSNYYTTAVASNGAVTFDATGAGAAFTFADGVTANVFASSGVTITGGTINSTSIGATTRSTGAFTTLAANAGLTVSASGASISGGINNNAGGITNAGAISGATSINASGTITGGTITDGTGSLSSGALTGLTGIAQASGNFAQSGSGSFDTGTGSVSLNGTTTVATGKNFAITNGTYIQGFSTGSSGTANALTVTDSSSSGATTLNGSSIALVGTATGGTNTITGITFPNITPAPNNTFTGISFGTGFSNLLSYNGGAVINGSGILQTGSVSGSYTGITGVGTITAGTWQGSTVAVAYGGTGAASFTTNGLLYGNSTSAVGVTAAGTTGQCLVGTTGSAPSWGSCGGAVTLQNAYTGGNTITTTSGNDLAVTLASNSNATFNLATGNTGKFAVQNNGTDLLKVTIAGGTVVNSGNFAVSSGTTALGGALSITSGGINVGSTGITNAGSIAGATTIAANNTETLSGTGGNELAVTGAPLTSSGAASSLLQLGSAIAQGSAIGNYIGVNAPTAFLGDFADFETNGTSVLTLNQSGGNALINAADGSLNLQSFGSTVLSVHNNQVTTSQEFVNSDNGAASVPAELLTGTWYSGGSGSSTMPQFLLQPTGTSSSNWNVNGTAIGADAASGFTGNLADLQLNGTSEFKVSSAGAVTEAGALTVSSGGASISGGINNNAGGITNTGAISGATTIAANNTETLSGTGGNELAVTGAPLTSSGGSSSLIQLGSAISSGSAAGTYLGMNTGSGFTGNLVDLQKNGTSQFSVASTGAVTEANTLTVATGGAAITGAITLTDADLNFVPVTKPIAPTMAAGASGAITGSYEYEVTYTTSQGETIAGAASSVVTVSSKHITVTIPTSADPRVTGRKIYRSTDSFYGYFFYVATVADNTTTTYSDNATDGSISGNAQIPAIDSTAGTILVNGTQLAVFSQNAAGGGKVQLNTAGGADDLVINGTGNTSTGITINSSGGGQSIIRSGTNGFNIIPQAGELNIAAQNTGCTFCASLYVGNQYATFSGSNNGTQIAAVVQSSFTGNLIDLQVDSSSKFSVSAAGAATVANGLTITAGGATVTAGGVSVVAGGINIHTTGITNAGSIAGATTVNASSTITGGTLTDGTASITAGAISGATTISASSTISSTATTTAFQDTGTPTSTNELIKLGSVLGSPSSNGTFIGINPSSFTGNFADFQVNGTSEFKVTAAGNTTINGNLVVSGTGTHTFAGTIQVAALTSTGTLAITTASNGNVNISPNGSGKVNFTLTTGTLTVGDGGTTNYANFDNNGALTFNGAARPYSEITLDPIEAITPGSANCTVNQTNDGNGFSYKTMDCPTGADDSGSWQFKLPQNYASGTNVTVDVYWEDTASGSTNTARFDVGYVSVPSGSSFAGATLNTVTGSAVASGGQNKENDNTITLTAPSMNANDLAVIRILRKGTVDTLGDTAKVLNVRLKFQVSS